MEIPKLYIKEYTEKILPTEYLLCYEEDTNRMIKVLPAIGWRLTFCIDVLRQYPHLEFKKFLEVGSRDGKLSRGHKLITEEQFLIFLDRVGPKCLGDTLDTLLLFYGGSNADT